MKELSRHHGLPALGLLVLGILGTALHFLVPSIEVTPGTIGDMWLMQFGTLLMGLGLAGACFIAGLLWGRAYDEQRALLFGFCGALAGAVVVFAS